MEEFIFNSKKEAENWLIENGAKRMSTHRNMFYFPGVYELSHGEYEKPDYSIRKISGENKYRILKKRYFYPGTLFAKENTFVGPENR